MEEILYLNELYDLYSGLLTQKQRQYFEDYYFHNLSYSEMSENYQVSRNAIFKQVHFTMKKLLEYERQIGLYAKNQKIKEIISTISDKSIQKQLEDLL